MESSIDNNTQRRLPYNDESENDNINRVGREANVPLSPLDNGSSRCNDINSELRRRRRPTEQANRNQFNQQLRQSQTEGQESEPEIVLPATSSTFSQKTLFVLRPVHRYLDLVCICLSVLAYLLETTMNAALAIFGIGVGVGLVLGDSFRAAIPMLPSVQMPQQQQQQSVTVSNATQATTEIITPPSVPNLLPAQ